MSKNTENGGPKPVIGNGSIFTAAPKTTAGDVIAREPIIQVYGTIANLKMTFQFS